MLDEQISFAEGGVCRVDEIRVPDIQCLGLFVSSAEQEVINFAYQWAVTIQHEIMGRNRRKKWRRKKFRLDIPDLWLLLEGKVRPEERQVVADFTAIFQALVHHLLPNAQTAYYSYDGKTRHGTRYIGKGWVS